jgi:dTDP-4-dehydrorhamnose 3,5-epimerase
MLFHETPLKGAFLIEPERIEDERGFFARTFCRQEFEARGLNPDIAQCSLSFNRRKGTLRGMHFQAAPHAEDKVVRCTGGAIYDVIVDLRPDSPTFKQWTAADLTAESRRMFYIPAGCAHGFQTLCDNAEVLYQISESYHPESARGVRWDDPAFAIVWPAAGERIISAKDKSWEDFRA